MKITRRASAAFAHDLVMAAIASGVIGLIIGNAISH